MKQKEILVCFAEERENKRVVFRGRKGTREGWSGVVMAMRISDELKTLKVKLRELGRMGVGWREMRFAVEKSRYGEIAKSGRNKVTSLETGRRIR